MDQICAEYVLAMLKTSAKLKVWNADEKEKDGLNMCGIYLSKTKDLI